MRFSLYRLTLGFRSSAAFAMLFLLITLHRPGTDAQEPSTVDSELVLRTEIGPLGQFAPSVRFSPDGNLIAIWKRIGVENRAGTEFTLWDVQTGNQRLKLAERFVGFAFSSDGKALVVWDPTAVSVRDTATGDQLASLNHGNVERVWFLRNGELLATATESQIKLWDTAVWQEKIDAIDRFGPFWGRPELSSDGNTVASLVRGADELVQLKIWHLESGAEQLTPNLNVPIENCTISFSLAPDGQTLCIIASLEEVYYWDVANSRLKTERDLVYPSLARHNEETPADKAPFVSVKLSGEDWVVRDWSTERVLHTFRNSTKWQRDPYLQFSPDLGSRLTGNQLLFLSSTPLPSGEINVWNTQSQLLTDTIRTDAPITQTALSRDGRTLAVRTARNSPDGVKSNRRVAIWDLTDRTEKFVFDYDEFVRKMEFSPDGSILAIQSEEGVELRDTSTGERVLVPDRTVNCVAFSFDGTTISTASSKSVQIRELKSGQILSTLDVVSDADIECLTYSQDDQHLAVVTRSSIDLWNVAQRHIEWTSTTHGGNFAEFSPDGTTLVAGTRNWSIGRWSLHSVADGSLISDAKKSNSGGDETRFLHFMPDKPSLNVVPREFPEVSFHNLSSGKKTTIESFGTIDDSTSVLGSHRIAVNGTRDMIAFCTFAYRYNDRIGGVALINTITGKQTGKLSAPTSDIQALLFSHDGSTIIGGGAELKSTFLEVIDLHTEQKVATLINEICTAHSTDGEYIVTRDLSMSDFVTLWKTRGPRKLAKMPIHLHMVGLSPEGKTLATTQKGKVYLWDVSAD